MNNLTMRTLQVSDAEALSHLLTEDPDYSQYFVPFETPTPAYFTRLLDSADLDCYRGIFKDDELVGMYMLRGFDEGYTRPSFGVYISKACAGCGLATLALRWCLSYCRLNRLPAVMLKVHPDNDAARHIYEKNGFVFLQTDSRTGHQMMEKRWDSE